MKWYWYIVIAVAIPVVTALIGIVLLAPPAQVAIVMLNEIAVLGLAGIVAGSVLAVRYFRGRGVPKPGAPHLRSAHLKSA